MTPTLLALAIAALASTPASAAEVDCPRDYPNGKTLRYSNGSLDFPDGKTFRYTNGSLDYPDGKTFRFANGTLDYPNGRTLKFSNGSVDDPNGNTMRFSNGSINGFTKVRVPMKNGELIVRVRQKSASYDLVVRTDSFTTTFSVDDNGNVTCDTESN